VQVGRNTCGSRLGVHCEGAWGMARGQWTGRRVDGSVLAKGPEEKFDMETARVWLSVELCSNSHVMQCNAIEDPNKAQN
jgi:hypothetical protein